MVMSFKAGKHLRFAEALVAISINANAFARLCFHVRRDLLTEFPTRIPFESFSGLSPTSVDPNAFGVGRDPAWGGRRGEVQRVERPAAGGCPRGGQKTP